MRRTVRLLLLLPNVVDRRREVGCVLGCGLIDFVKFWQTCRFLTNLLHGLFCDSNRVSNLLLRITSQPKVEDALIPCFLGVLVDATQPITSGVSLQRPSKTTNERRFRSPKYKPHASMTRSHREQSRDNHIREVFFQTTGKETDRETDRQGDRQRGAKQDDEANKYI